VWRRGGAGAHQKAFINTTKGYKEKEKKGGLELKKRERKGKLWDLKEWDLTEPLRRLRGENGALRYN